MHEFVHQPWDNVCCHGNDANSTINMSVQVALFVITGPTSNAFVAQLLDAIVAFALLDARKMLVLGKLHNDLWADILSSSTRHIVNDARPIFQTRLNVHDNPASRSLSIIGIDEQRAVHAHCEAFLRGIHHFGGGIAPRVSYDCNAAFEFSHTVSNECKVFFPGEQVPLTSRAANDECLNTICNLMFNKLVPGLIVNISILSVWCFDSRHESKFPNGQRCRGRCHLCLLSCR
mmetsp:Transcript_132124/g.263665  ORF Transcript_132124/g.263665 Transcript_132124/m.263665 type:complete len:232 (+) Transcript_132124:521-1216(+)